MMKNPVGLAKKKPTHGFLSVHIMQQFTTQMAACAFKLKTHGVVDIFLCLLNRR